ncbi:MAG: OB-fold domain-containing protein [Pseudomonadales bacterium]|nr:OB-fold domain-containing protein [Pseudomonadales bacterium]
MTTTSLPPQPKPNLDTEGFWQATKSGQLSICRCQECQLWLQPPLERCRQCGATTRFEAVSGKGSIYSFVVVRHGAVPGYLDTLPYVVAIIELDEQVGLRLPTRLLDVAPETVEIGQRVAVQLVDLPGGEFRVACFRQASD